MSQEISGPFILINQFETETVITGLKSTTVEKWIGWKQRFHKNYDFTETLRENSYVTLFVPNAPFLYPLKT